MRLLFAGTPEAALPSLRALLDSRHEVVGVLTRADAPSGRGRTLRPSPVRVLADEAGIPVLTPRSLRDPQVQQQLRDLAPEVAPVVAYGNLIPPAALEIPAHGWINLHFSMLPAWRGAAPAQRAVLAGQRETGMTVFRLEEGLDTGEVITARTEPIGRYEASGQLLERLASSGAQLLLESIDARRGHGHLHRPGPLCGHGCPEAVHLRGPHRLDSARRAGQRPHPGHEPGSGGMDPARRQADEGPGSRGAPDGGERARTAPRPARRHPAPPAGRHGHRTSRPGDRGSGRQAGHARTGLGPGSRPRSRGRLRR